MLENNLKNYISKNKWLLIILLASFSLSVFYSFYFQIKPRVDARAYDVIAQNIIKGLGYRENLSVDVAHDYAIGRVGPLYEYFLAGVYKIFGHYYGSVWILQALLHAISAYLIYLICLLVFAGSSPYEGSPEGRESNRFDKLITSKKIGLWAAAIFGFYPDLIEISAMLMTETLYLFFTCLMVYLFLFYIKKDNFSAEGEPVYDWNIFLALSFILGVAILVRPPLLFSLPIIFFYFYKKREWGRWIIMIFMLILVFLPWTASNYKTYGGILPFGVAGALNFWIGNHIGANGEQESSKEISDYIAVNKVVDVQKESMDQFKGFVLNYPGEFIRLTFLRINKYFSILRPMGFWMYSSGWRQTLFVFSSFIFSCLVFILSFGGILRACKLSNTYINYLLAFTIFTPLILFITVVETRYRFQIYPFLAIFSAYYISLFEWDKKLWFKNLLAPSAFILLNGLVDGLINFNQFKDKLINYF
jgi:4-amino-4-deoxy-L-arabinose transferase-like glycosyltransferase